MKSSAEKSRNKLTSRNKGQNPYGVKVGEIWLACDRRERGRQIRIQEVKGDKARVARLDALGTPGPSTWIKLASFYKNSRGYERAAKTESPTGREQVERVNSEVTKTESATGCEQVERTDVPGEDPDPNDGEAETGEEPDDKSATG